MALIQPQGRALQLHIDPDNSHVKEILQEERDHTFAVRRAAPIPALLHHNSSWYVIFLQYMYLYALKNNSAVNFCSGRVFWSFIPHQGWRERRYSQLRFSFAYNCMKIFSWAFYIYRGWYHSFRGCHVAPPCFYSSPEWTNHCLRCTRVLQQTVTNWRTELAYRVFFCCWK